MAYPLKNRDTNTLRKKNEMYKPRATPAVSKNARYVRKIGSKIPIPPNQRK